MQALVRFHVGRITYNKGDEVPQEIVDKYPHLVGAVVEKEKKEIVVEEEKVERISLTQKVRKK